MVASIDPDEQDVTAAHRIRADPAQPDHARMVHLLPSRRQQTHLLGLGPLGVASGRSVADDAASLEVDRPPTTIHQPERTVDSVIGRRESVVQPRSGPGHPIPLPRQHRDPLGAFPHITAVPVESPLRREAHGGFGERSGETGLSNQDTAPRPTQLQQLLQPLHLPAPLGQQPRPGPGQIPQLPLMLRRNKRGRTSPCAPRSASHSASETSDLRPGMGLHITSPDQHHIQLLAST